MKKVVIALLVALVAGGWFAVPASAAEIERFADTESGSKAVLLLNPDTVVVKAIGPEGDAYLGQFAIVGGDGEAKAMGYLGVKEKECAAGKGLAVAFEDLELQSILGRVIWGNDPDNVWTKAVRRVCELGRSKAGI